MQSSRSRHREKLLHAIVFFVTNTKRCQKTKLFKLLFLLDFGVFRATGKSVTGLRYFAWPKGPVPKDLFEEFDSPEPDLAALVALRRADLADPEELGFGVSITAKKNFNASLFTRREIETMERLAEIYLDAKASDMVEVTHLAQRPWHQIFVVQKQHQGPIPYELALDSKPDSITKEQADLIAEEAREVAALFE
jgi:uncharacterized phage-associated protein